MSRMEGCGVPASSILPSALHLSVSLLLVGKDHRVGAINVDVDITHTRGDPKNIGCNAMQVILKLRQVGHCTLNPFLATLVALHFTPVSEWVSKWAEFRTSVASRLASLFQWLQLSPYFCNLSPLSKCFLRSPWHYQSSKLKPGHSQWIATFHLFQKAAADNCATTLFFQLCPFFIFTLSSAAISSHARRTALPICLQWAASYEFRHKSSLEKLHFFSLSEFRHKSGASSLTHTGYWHYRLFINLGPLAQFICTC